MSITEFGRPLILDQFPKNFGSVHFTPDPINGLESMQYLFSEFSNQLGPSASVMVKWFDDVPHGVLGGEELGWILVSDILKGLYSSEGRIPSVSGVLKSQTGDFYVIPMMDLEIPASVDGHLRIQPEVEKLAVHLSEKGIGGFILRSGDPGLGSHWYVADFALPYEPFFWCSFGYLMTVMFDDSDASLEGIENSFISQQFAERLINCRDYKEAREVGEEMLLRFPSVPSGCVRSGLWYDPRWVGHRLVQGVNTLVRVKRSKGYKSLPKLLVDIY